MNDIQIVFPLDVSQLREGYALMEQVGPYIDLPKVGLELMHSVGTPTAVAMIKEFGKPFFADAKLNDIPNTVKGAAKALTRHGVEYFNVMASGGRPMMEAAVEGAHEAAKEFGIKRPKVIAVTVLTSLKVNHLVELGIAPFWITRLSQEEQEKCLEKMSDKEKQEAITGIVMRWAAVATSAGADCLLSSPLEIAAMRANYHDKELFCPGIRMPWDSPDDQERTASPGEAVKAGVNAIVVGRPIRKPPEGMTRRDVIKAIRANIAKAI